MSTADVATPSLFHQAMAPKWKLIDALRGGTKAMRDAGSEFLPKENKEEVAAWQARLRRSILFNAYWSTVGRIVAKPFSRPVVVKEGEKLPEQLAPILTNADKRLHDLTQFARELFVELVHKGVAHIYVEHPAPAANLKQEREQDVRPYFSLVKADALIGARWTADATGKPSLKQIRIRESVVQPDGEWGEKRVDQIRVIDAPVQSSDPETPAVPGRWRVFRRVDRSWTQAESGTHDFPGIPLVTINLKEVEYLRADPPLEDLAWLNLAHWQSSSDQRTILRFARIPVYFMSGISSEELKKQGSAIYAGKMFASEAPEARMNMVEHSGAAIEAGRKDLSDLEERMEILGLQPFIARTGNQTATARAMDEASTQSEVQAWVGATENGLVEAFKLAATWAEVDLPDGFAVDIFNDFGLSVRAAEEIRSLIIARQTREISRETFLKEIKRRGLLSDEVVIEDEIERIQDEPPPLGTLGGGAGGGDDDPDDEGGAGSKAA